MQASNSTARPSIVRPQISYDGRGFGLEWSGGRLAQEFAGGIRLWDRASWKVLKEIPIKPIIAFGALADDSLVAVAKKSEESENEEVIHIPTAGEPRHYRADWPIIDERHELLPNRASPRQFFLLQPDRQRAALWELPQKRGLVREVKTLSLPVPAQDTVVALGDGSLVYNELSDLQRVGPIPTRDLPPKRVVT